MSSLCVTCRSIDYDKLFFGRAFWEEKQKGTMEYQTRALLPTQDASEGACLYLGSFQEVAQRAADSCSMCSLILARHEQRCSRDAEFKRIPTMDSLSKEWNIWLCSIGMDLERFANVADERRANKLLAHFVPNGVTAGDMKYFGNQRLGSFGLELRCIHLFNHIESVARVIDDVVEFDTIRRLVIHCEKTHICEYRTPNLKVNLLSNLLQNAHLKTFRPTSSRSPSDAPLKNFRLIDVHSYRIIEGSFSRYPRYATLSYTWGSPGENYCLTQDKPCLSLDSDGMKSIPLPTLLPSTISDAIMVTKELGLAYIWIDSLCIVQDDESDKAKQIKEMAAIYINAVICIAAAAGVGPNAGLPGVRYGTREKQTLVQVRQDMYLGLSSPTVDAVITESRWGSRAWTFQEFMLSRRSLIFSDFEVIFYCGDESYHETWKFIENRQPNGYTKHGEGKARTMADLVRDAVLPINGVKEAYRECVKEYMSRSMLYDSDGLNAFLGISQVMEGYLKSEMLHGLPKSYMLEALAWRAEGKVLRRRTHGMLDGERRNAAHPMFPSWSWVAWDGMIKFENPDSWIGRVESGLFLVDPALPFNLLVKRFSSDFASEPSDSDHTKQKLRGILSLYAKCAYFNIDSKERRAVSKGWKVDASRIVIIQDESNADAGYISIASNEERTAFPTNALCMELYTAGTWCVILVLNAVDFSLNEVSSIDDKLPELRLAPATRDLSMMTQSSTAKAAFNLTAQILGASRQLKRRERKFKVPSNAPLLAYRIALGYIKENAWSKSAPKARLILLG